MPRGKTELEIANDEFAEAEIRAMTDAQRKELAIALQHSYNDLMRVVEDFIDNFGGANDDTDRLDAFDALCGAVGYR